ncbi:MAG TPA: hypothetical protein VKE93_02100 [Candidatus Angelobacter sp.]|nr:hypothetical protein [Candidatus Angelobacter sp.]
MSETALRVTPQDYAPPAVIGRMRMPALTVGILAAVLALALAASLHRWPLFLQSWLVAFLFWLGLTLGSLVLLMLQYVSGGNWGRVGRRFWEAASGNLPLMFAAWLPIAFGVKVLYSSWALPFDQAVAKLGWEKVHYYLNPGFFWFRGVFYFLGWWLLYARLMRWSKREEAGQTTPAQFVSIQNLSGFGIVFYAATITFASIDWAMSLYPEWWSTVWGMLFMVGEVLTAFCFTIWLLVKLAPIEPLSRMFKIDYLHDFGKLMFAFVVLWAYLSFSQWLIIWSGNMLSEIRWYLMRLNGGWQYFGTALIFVHFVFPFALLLSRSLKRHGRRIVLVAALILFMRLIDLFWLTAPNFYSGFKDQAEAAGLKGFGWPDAAMYILCPIALGGIWLFLFFLRLEKRSLMPVNDPHFVEMLEAKHG